MKGGILNGAFWKENFNQVQKEKTILPAHVAGKALLISV